MRITYKREISKKSIREEEIIADLLNDRSITDAASFRQPTHPTSISLKDFGCEKELKTTLSLLEEIKKKGETVVVYTDYDADGITGGSILWETLHLLGFKAIPYVPHRQHEGYGFSVKGIDAVKEKHNPALIISVDHGITAREKVTYAKSIGIPIIITDHHLKPEKIPEDAVAIFHFPVFSGSGLSYFFSKEIFDHFSKKETLKNESILQQHFNSDYLALASIGTVADLVPLVGPSRSVVKYGLAAFKHIDRCGIRQILKEAGIENKPITTYEIGFVIAPRINAVGRLEHAIDAMRLLCTNSEEKARELAHSVGRTNQERQSLVNHAVEEATKQAEIIAQEHKILILTSDDWHEGIIGLIASKMVEKWYRPTIIMTKVDGFLKGSARSIPSFHITNFLRSLKKYLIDAGGHAQAAGFTIEEKNVEAFIKAAQEEADKLISDTDLERTIETDLKIPLSYANTTLTKLIEELQPFGVGNPQPVFFSEAVITGAQVFGNQGQHLKVFVKEEGSTAPALELMAFSKGEEFTKISKNQKVEVVYQPMIDRWNGTERLRGKLIYWQ